MVNADFNVTNKCCKILKKDPARRYEKQNSVFPIIGTMASESSLRKQKYLKTSCNVLEGNHIASYPLSIFTDDDIWTYIKMFNVKYCSLYDKGFERTGCMVCGFGAQYDKCRFERLKTIHPKAHRLFMSYKNNGIDFNEAIKFTYNHGK